MDEVQIYSELLELKAPWKVESVSLNSGKNVVEVFIDHDKGSKLPCPECRKECMVYDHLRERVWRDLDSIGFKTFVHAKPPRIQCPEHGIREAVMPLSEKRSRFTLRFESKSVRMLQNMDLLNFTKIMDISWKQAWNIIEHAVHRGLSRKRSSPRIICIDDKSFRKGHEYITTVIDYETKGVDFVSFDRRKRSLDQYYDGMSEESRSKIIVVSMDMWDPYISSTLENVPEAHGKIVFDRFHVMRHVNDAVDTTRKEENRELVKKGIMDLKGTRYLWLYSGDNLPERYRQRYGDLKALDLMTGKAYSMKENIRSLWDPQSLEEAKEYWKNWLSWVMHSSIDAMKKVAKMMRMHIDKILNYFTHSITNANAEGINSKIALIEKMAYGFRNRSHLRTSIYFRCGNLELYP